MSGPDRRVHRAWHSLCVMISLDDFLTAHRQLAMQDRWTLRPTRSSTLFHPSWARRQVNANPDALHMASSGLA